MAITLRKPIDHIGYQAILVKQVTYVCSSSSLDAIYFACCFHTRNRGSPESMDGKAAVMSEISGG